MALNFNWEMLLEPSLFTEDPWWLYILYGAGWTIGLAVSAFALALAVGIVIGTLRTVENRFVRGSAKPGSNSSATFRSSSRSSSGTSCSPNSSRPTRNG